MAKTLHLNCARLLAVGLIGATLAVPMGASAGLNAAVTGAVGTNTPVLTQTPPPAEQQTIMAKAARLGVNITGTAVSGLETVPGGFRIRFQKCDIYFSPTVGCNEVRGDIRDKFNARGGPAGDLGLPASGERIEPDGIGRYNEFVRDAAIYSTPDTGPMVVRGTIRRTWPAVVSGDGPLGYPTADEHVFGGKAISADALDHLVGGGSIAAGALQPVSGVGGAGATEARYSDFQNGVIYTEGNQVRQPLTAALTPVQLESALSKFLQANIVGVEPLAAQIDSVRITEVTNTGYGTQQSRNRLVTVHVVGHLEDLIDFEMDLRLLFVWRKEADGTTSLRVALSGGQLNATGREHGIIFRHVGNAEGMRDALQTKIGKTFANGPVIIAPAIPATVDVLSFKVFRNGGLKLFLRPSSAAEIVRPFIQSALGRMEG